tara:strand:- start:47 stop:208 length:162 start_codon:yes stop_codon:yes gene_type:complete
LVASVQNAKHIFEDLREPEQIFGMRQGKVREKTLNQYMRKTLPALKKKRQGML